MLKDILEQLPKKAGLPLIKVVGKKDGKLILSTADKGTVSIEITDELKALKVGNVAFFTEEGIDILEGVKATGIKRTSSKTPASYDKCR